MAHIQRGRRRTLGRSHGVLRHFFVPGAHNNHRPHALRIPSTIVIGGATVLTFLVALASLNLVVRSPSPQIGAVVAAVLVDLANADRVADGLSKLRVSPTLAEAAQMKADDMAAHGYFSHDTPDGKTPWYWFQEAGYRFRHAGENLAVYFSDSKEVEKAWMESPLHRANILGDQFTEIGIAIAHGEFEGYETTFVVQMFGTPAGGETNIASSESPGATANVAGASAEAKPIGALGDSPSTLWHLASAPKTTLQYIYIGLGVLLLFAVTALFLGELRRLHIPSLMRGGALLLVIGLLYWGSTLVTGTLIII